MLVAFVVLEHRDCRPCRRSGSTASGFLTGRVWDPNTERYGILAEIWGTLYTSVLALVLGTAFGVAAAMFLSEGFLGQAVFELLRRANLHLHPVLGASCPIRLERVLKNLIELLAAIPERRLRAVGPVRGDPADPAALQLAAPETWAGSRSFRTDLSGPGVLPAVLVLAIMILPTITAISRDALVSVPPKLRMAAYGLGATRWETILAVILPTASRGIFGGHRPRLSAARSARRWRWRCWSATPTRSPVAVLAGEHAGRAARQQFPGSGREAGRRADVRGAGAARDHAGGQHRRRGRLFERAGRQGGGSERPDMELFH